MSPRDPLVNPSVPDYFYSCPSIRRRRSPQWREHMDEKLRAHAHARVRDGDLDVGIHALEPDLNLSAPRNELDRVREKVEPTIACAISGHRSAVLDRDDIVNGREMSQALERTQRYRRDSFEKVQIRDNGSVLGSGSSEGASRGRLRGIGRGERI